MSKVTPSILEPFVNSEGNITDIWYKYLLSLSLLEVPTNTGSSDENEIQTIGKVFTSLLPITDDDNIHLLNGDVLAYSDEKYKNFIDYIASLLTDYPSLFCTETEYQESISNYGICGKFVYNENNKTVRLPLTIKRNIVAKKEATSSRKNWYNLYSDGFIEQGGQIDITASGWQAARIINLDVSMLDTNYIVFWMSGYNEYIDHDTTITARTKTSFSISQYTGYQANANWEVKGYADISSLQNIQFQTQYDYIIINDLTNSSIKKYLDANASKTIDKYVDNTSKPELDNYTTNKKAEIKQVSDEVIGKLLDSDKNIPLLKFDWFDHEVGDISWLRADTFSWQSGTVYTAAYNHLVDDYNSEDSTEETETINGLTIIFKRCRDGHKICDSTQQDVLINLYNTVGVAWYYILDTENTRFKLPRTKYGFNGLRKNVGDYIDESLPNIKGTIGGQVIDYTAVRNSETTGAFYVTSSSIAASNSTNSGNGYKNVALDASLSSSTYQDNAPVQERATQTYLYFYVGNYTQQAIEQTAGLNTELFNDKVDTDLNNVSLIAFIDIFKRSGIVHIIDSYINGTSGYNIYSNGYCEQWGTTMTSTANITFVKNYKSVPVMTWGFVTTRSSASYDGEVYFRALSVSGFTGGSRLANAISPGFMWRAHGYLPEGSY